MHTGAHRGQKRVYIPWNWGYRPSYKPPKEEGAGNWTRLLCESRKLSP